MKRLILSDFMGDGAGRLFVRLLDDWGRWERSGTGIHGFSRGCLEAPHFIDDETAMIISAAAGRVKEQSEALFKILELRYIHDLETNEILKIFRKLIDDKRARYMRESIIDKLIEEASQRLYEELHI